MLWQVVGFHFPAHADQIERRAFEANLAGLAEAVDDLTFVTVTRSLEDPDTTCYVSCFADRAAFDRYLEHPAHLPIADAAAKITRDITRLLFIGDDPRRLSTESSGAPAAN